jgi:hypothetical protein
MPKGGRSGTTIGYSAEFRERRRCKLEGVMGVLEIETIKRTAVENALSSAVKSKLWAVKNIAEGSIEEFPKNITKIKKLLHDAEEIYLEWQKVKAKK